MANVKTTPEQWARAREYYEAGLSFREIEGKLGVLASSVCKKAKSDNWPKIASKETLVKKRLIDSAVAVESAKSTLCPVELSVHKELVEERTKHVLFFNHAAMQNVREAMNLGCESQQDHKLRSDTIAKAREVVLGPQDKPTTAIQINNNSVSLEDLLRDL